jgi:pimeloyl-ACP methyl ester carboxylesterase
MAKIGPGTGSRTIDAGSATRHGDFLTRVDVAAAALDLLRHTVPSRPLIVAGHSEGAVVASLLAAGPAGAEIDGLVSLSGPALPILSIMRLQVAAMEPAGSEPDMAVFDRTVAAIRSGHEVPPESKTNPQTAMLATMPEQALAYLRSVDKVDPVAALGKVRQPVLIVQGGRDDSVPLSHADALLAGRRNLATEMATFPTLTHFYKVATADLPPMEAMMLNTQSDPAVADVIAQWIYQTKG